ncbi:MAG: xanthine dehydrogenase family protein molybdopterin-binding subunit [Pseudomonadota bacterium]|nr:xanthine dehydrogenase family protein molybdopterin-binding subunit [Pseudomonadota bacterium]
MNVTDQSTPTEWGASDPANPVSGRGLFRTEDFRLLTGAGCYIDDFKLGSMVYAVVVRSAVGHGRINAIDVSAALELPGVLAVYTYDDISAYAKPIPIRLAPLAGLERYLQFPLAKDRVRYVGEPVALVVAEDRYVAEDAADLVYIDCDSRDAVVDVHAAMADDVLLFDEAGTNVASHYTVGRGDAKLAFAEAEYVRKETFYCHRHSAMPLETRGLAATWDTAEGRLTVWGATKVPFFNRSALAAMLGLEEQKIAMVELDVGGSFGVRGEFYPEDFLIPFAAFRLGRPVKWIEDRRESFIATNHSREMECELEIATRKDGTIVALRASILADMGAYVRTNGGVVPAKAAQLLPGPYRILNFECDVRALVTNKTPVGTYRGPGRYEANFFRERLFDLAAEDLGIDPVEFRRRNLIRAVELPFDIGNLVPYMAGGDAYDTGDYHQALQKALDAIEYPRLSKLRRTVVDGKLQGVGIACFVESSGGGPAESARIVIKGPQTIELYTGCCSSGQGQETVMAQILADELGIPFDRIAVFHGSTDYVSRGYGTYHSRGVVMGGSAIKVTAQKLISQAARLVAQRAGVAAESIEFRDGGLWHDKQEAPLASLEALASEAADGSEEALAALQAEGTFENTRLTYTYGTHIAHVAVDPETATVEVLRYMLVEDVGRAINPLIVHGQSIGAAVQGMGGTFLEEFVYDEFGQSLTGTFADYLLPPSPDFPNVEAITLQNFPSKLNPLGAKGAGEGGIVATGAALANAVADALHVYGVKICDLPLSPNKLSRLIRESKLPT